MKVSVNINDIVHVKLTEHGEKIAEDSGLVSEEEIASGNIQFHVLMYVFGKHCYNGSKLSFWMNEIELLKVTYEKD